MNLEFLKENSFALNWAINLISFSLIMFFWMFSNSRFSYVIFLLIIVAIYVMSLCISWVSSDKRNVYPPAFPFVTIVLSYYMFT